MTAGEGREFDNVRDMEDDKIRALIEELKNYIIDNSETDEEKAMDLLRRLNSYSYYISFR